MRRPLFAILISLAAACGGDNQAPGPPDTGTAPVPGCADGVMAATGARYRICFPASWNGDLIVYAHGYRVPDAPLEIPDDEFEGQRVADLVTGLGYAYATTSYRANGLVVPDAVLDIVDLIDAVRERVRPDPTRTFIAGFSEGGLVATLVAERYPAKIDGAVAGCGPIGDFQRQLDYIGDVRVVFDYFFPGVLPGTAVSVPVAVRENWTSQYEPAVVSAMVGDRDKVRQLIRVVDLPIDPADSTTAVESVLAALFYNIFGTEDARARLGGQAFDNTDRVYAGSGDDVALNRDVARFAADPAAIDRVREAFQTSGHLTVPVVTMHTTEDPDVPEFHEPLYAAKVMAAGATPWLRQMIIDRYGHCVFTRTELIAALAAVTGP